MPWLMTEVQEEMQKMITSKDIISGNDARFFSLKQHKMPPKLKITPRLCLPDIVRDVLETRAELKRATADSPSDGVHSDARPSPEATVCRGARTGWSRNEGDCSVRLVLPDSLTTAWCSSGGRGGGRGRRGHGGRPAGGAEGSAEGSAALTPRPACPGRAPPCLLRAPPRAARLRVSAVS